MENQRKLLFFKNFLLNFWCREQHKSPKYTKYMRVKCNLKICDLVWYTQALKFFFKYFITNKTIFRSISELRILL